MTAGQPTLLRRSFTPMNQESYLVCKTMSKQSPDGPDAVEEFETLSLLHQRVLSGNSASRQIKNPSLQNLAGTSEQNSNRLHLKRPVARPSCEGRYVLSPPPGFLHHITRSVNAHVLVALLDCSTRVTGVLPTP